MRSLGTTASEPGRNMGKVASFNHMGWLTRLVSGVDFPLVVCICDMYNCRV